MPSALWFYLGWLAGAATVGALVLLDRHFDRRITQSHAMLDELRREFPEPDGTCTLIGAWNRCLTGEELERVRTGDDSVPGNLLKKAPPDPVREQMVACIREAPPHGPWGRSLYEEMADAILARFNVTPKGGDDA